MQLLDKIYTEVNSFSKTDQKLIDYIRVNNNIIYKTINEVMEESGVGYGTIIRFCKKVGCSGFQDFKIRLASEGYALHNEKHDKELLIENKKANVVHQTENTLRNINQELLDTIVTEIEGANRILIIGVAGSYPCSLELGYRLTRLGFPSVMTESDKDMQAFKASLLKENDILFIISYSGMTKSILKAAELASNSNAKIIAMTNYTKSSIMEYADYVLITSIREQALEAEVGTRLPFYLLVELLTETFLDKNSSYIESIESTYNSVSDSQI